MDLKNSERLGQFQKLERDQDGFTKWEKLGMDSKIGMNLKVGKKSGRIQKLQRNMKNSKIVEILVWIKKWERDWNSFKSRRGI